VSPDRKWIAYTSNESGQNELYAVPSDRRAPSRVSNAGGRESVWRRDGSELFFIDANDWISAVSVKDGSFGPPARLFHIEPGVGHTRLDPIFGNTYDVSPDGQRFLVNQAVNGITDLQMNVIVR
ncbi:MAG: TolB family protein, partial [Pyrinomonadaceae bacterium]